jgi:NADPH-dependent curcumin reductase CurA
MPITPHLYRRIVLAKRPQGAPNFETFSLQTLQLPALNRGQVLLRTVFLSLDPYMRGRISEAKSYAQSVGLGELMVGATVSRVLASMHPEFKPGELVLGNTGWQDHAISDGSGLSQLDPQMTKPSWALGVLGMPGFTAYTGLLEIGQAKAGDTVVVAAATGAVGALVGQIAKIKGCRVVGIAGGAEKCRYAVEELGFDACVDHHDCGLADKLAAACPQGIDVYFENVGGAVFQAVLPLLNVGARVPVCGLIAQYNAQELPSGPDQTPLLMRALLTKRISMQGFIIFDHYDHRYGEFVTQMSQWLAEGRIKVLEDVVVGLENAPQAFIGLLEGRNFGKLVVQMTE